MATTQLIPSFNAGELSPLIHFRSDLEKYRFGCRTLRNMTLTPYGGAKRRPGLAYTSTCLGKTRLEPFQVSISQSFILELSALKIRFYKRDEIIQSGMSDYVVTTPYTDDDLFDLDIKQINNVAYFVHPDYPPYKLTRIIDNLWTFAEVDFSYPAMLSPNLDEDLTITTSAVGEIGDSITLTSSGSVFDTRHVDSYFELSHERPKDQFESKVKANSGTISYSPEIIIQGAYRFSTNGTWNGTFTIQKNDGSGWVDFAEYTSENDANFDVERVQEDRVKMRIKYDRTNGGSSDSYGLIDTAEPYITGLVKITQVNSASNAVADVIFGVQSGATDVWREGAWSEVQGYPRAICAHEQRLVFAGNANNPQTIWASAVDDYENFKPGNDDDDSWSHTLVSGQQNDIQWLVSEKALLVGTTGDEWVLSSSKEEGIITPTNVRARRHSGNGSDNISPILLDDSTIFVQRGGRVARKMAFSFEADGYRTEELTLLAEHITGTGIVDMALQTQPDQLIWCVTRDGRLLGLTLDDSQNVVGWHRHTTGASGLFESVAVRKVQGEDDQVWVVVKRIIDGNTVRYIERLKPDGFFLEEEWSLLYQDTYGMTPWGLIDDLVAVGEATGWDYHYVSYDDGDLIPYIDYSGGDDYMVLVQVPFTTTDASYDLQAGPEYWLEFYNDLIYPLDTITYPNHVGTRVQYWSGSSVGQTGRLFAHNGDIYHATGAGHAPGAVEPGVTVGWATYYTLLIENYTTVATAPPEQTVTGPTSDNWVQSDDGTNQQNIYVAGDKVGNNNAYYKCKLAGANDPKPETEPGVGASWTTVWEVTTYYAVDDEVVSLGLPYKCILAHTPTAAREPGVGADWEDYWELIQGEYADGDLVSEAGVNYICILTHTPSAASRPGIGASWETYWELETDEENLDFYVDSGVTLINPGIITQVTGLDHLEGETVQVFANGAVLADRAVSGGAIQLDQDGDPEDEITHISVGLQYDSLLEPMAIESMMQNGTSTGREKRIHELVIYFHDSYSCKIGESVTGTFDLVRFYDGENITPTLYSGNKEVKLDARHTRDATFVLKQDLPMPFHILAIVCKFNVHGDQV